MTKPLSNPFSIPQTPMIPVLIPSESVKLAQQLAQGHPKPEQIKQTYHNLLAVLAVNHYLNMLGFQTDLSQCDCWNPFLRMTTSVADLEVVGYGRFECCPISVPDSKEGMAGVPERLAVPAEVQEDRIGYIAVQVDGDVQQGQSKVALLGFTDQLDSEEWVLSERRSLFDLPHFLEQLARARETTHLTHWLKDKVDNSWKTLETLFAHQEQPIAPVRTINSLRPSNTNGSRCMYGKTLNLSTQKREEKIILITEVIDNTTEEFSIELKICPTSPQVSPSNKTEFLPPGLEMVIVDVAGDAVMQAQARDGNRMVELGFHAEEGDRFQLHIQLDDTIITESFLV